jgi:thioredoxin reductase (NADPH)
VITINDLRPVALFDGLEEDLLRRIAARAAEVRLRPGEYAAREGEKGTFLVLLSGHMAVTKTMAGREKQLVLREPGDYFGEVPLLLGAPCIANFRAVRPSRLMRLSSHDFLSLLPSLPGVREILTQSLLRRVSATEDAVISAERLPLVIGAHFDPACHTLRDFLARNFVESDWLDPTNPDEHRCIPAVAQAAPALPLLVLPDDTVLSQPSLRAVANAVGLTTAPSKGEYDVVIVGGGPGGLSAAVYGASEGLQTLMIEATAPGGQAATSSRIENYLGFPIGVSGEELGSSALIQAKRFGAEIVVTHQVCTITPGREAHTLVLEDGITIRARAIVLSLGVSYRRLDVPGIDALVDAGVYYGAARTEALGCRGSSVYLIGGGNSAGQAAMFFANYAAQVTLLVRGPSLSASMSHYLINQLASRDNIVVRTHSALAAVDGHNHLEAIVVRDLERGVEERVPADAVFIFIGADANTGWLPPALARDKNGFLLTGREADDVAPDPTLDRDRFLLETSVPGIFAAGDVRHGSIKRVAAAVGEGSMAISFIHQYLAMQPAPSGATARAQ